MVIGIYVGFSTVFGAIWWYLYATQGPHVSFKQLTKFHDCQPGKSSDLFSGVDCTQFHNPAASTVALSVLVTIEMFNALNALSENQSLLTVTPLSNIWVLLAASLSFTLHFIIIYVPFFANVFHVAPLGLEEWQAVLCLSFPVLIIDELLKLVSRNFLSGVKGSKTRSNKEK